MSGIPDYREHLRNVNQHLAPMREDLPAAMKAFNDLGKAVSVNGALERKTKELIALSLGVAARCDGCIGFHVQTLVKLGITRAELEEALAMAVYMGGGPSLMYSAHALAAFETFSPPPA
ncbi:MAG: carboxymuconolactone decarboxylase family protein [Rhodocyclaceae bacterium]